jgi:hypothetical protein
MKCLKNTKTGNIIRVDEKQALQMAGNTWRYVPKSEWRGVKEPEVVVPTTEVAHDMGGSYEVKKEKKSKKK